MGGSERFDVIIVGARCAGSPLAAFLARAGVRVCVVDQARFPSDTPSTHGIQPVGVQILERLGVLKSLLDIATPIERATIALGESRIEVDRISAVLGAPMLNVRRVHLDQLLLEAAAASGAEVRTRTPVTSLAEDAGRVTGVRTRTGVLRARLVVGADGVRSAVARLAGAEEYRRTSAGRLFVWGYFDGVATSADRVWLGKIGDHGFLGSPTDAGLFMAAIAPSIQRSRVVLADAAASHAEGLARWPELAETLAHARQVGPLRVMPRWHGYFRRSAGPGWVLLGDAGHFKDPTAGQGIADALRQAATLAPAIERGLAQPTCLDQELADWWSWRDRDAWQMYWFAHDMGAEGPTPRLVQHIQRRIAADPRLVVGLLRVLNHELPPSRLLTPSLAVRAAANALAADPHDRPALLREMAGLVGQELRRIGPPRRRRHVRSRPLGPVPPLTTRQGPARLPVRPGDS
jgi:2-polyprenyl-6-methoxyphenol hydroxylase-like FAD-dependent oxidoreductase